MARANKPGPGFWLRVLYRCTAAGVATLGAVASLFPVDTWVRLGGFFGSVVHRFDTRRRGRALRNLRETLRDEMPAPRRKQIVREMYRNMGRLAFEYVLLIGGRNVGHWSSRLEMSNVEFAHGAVDEHGAVIFVTCHGGNFELLGAFASEEKVQLHVVAKDLRNPYLTRRLNTMRERLGMGVIGKFPALRSILRALRADQSIAILSDQRRRNRGLIVRFFGRPAATVDTPAVLALRFGIPIVPGFSYRVGTGMHYEGYLDTPILPDAAAPKDEEIVRLTQAVNDSIERFVRAHPEQWNWTQPRWVISNRVRSRARERAGDARSHVGA